MKFKYPLFVFILSLTAILLSDTLLPPAPLPPQFSSRKRKRLTPEEQMTRFGGFVTKEYNGGYCYILNAQSLAGDEDFAWAVQQISQVLSLPIIFEKTSLGDLDIYSVINEKFKTDGKVASILLAIDSPSVPSLLIAPENSWAVINIRALNADSPNSELLSRRVKKEIWRGFTYLFGGGNSRLESCLMRPVFSLADLDDRPNVAPTPEPFNSILDTAKARGITSIRKSTYKQACIEGWAPMPTNESQRIIWERISADKERGPTKPLTIPPPKK